MNTSPLVFVVGGAGYIGSHCVLELLNNKYDVIVADSCSNAIKLQEKSLPESLLRVEKLANRRLKAFYDLDILNEKLLDQIFNEWEQKRKIDVVMHFAGVKAVGESVKKPLKYYNNNVSGTIKLLEAMTKYNVLNFVFSSSATVYGDPEYLPLDENHPTGRTCTNAYAKSKYMIEEILKDLCHSDPRWSVISLRYFNPVGAHSSGEIGEDPQDIPNNLMPFISQVAVGKRPLLQVYGNDFDTKDGTGVRDYIHIEDLAIGHVMIADKVVKDSSFKGWNVFNLGTGQGYSVLDVVDAFEKASGVKIPYKIVGRRPGDIASSYTDANLAKQKFGWTAKKTLHDMCASSWNWQSKNPNGYRTF